MKAQDSIAKRLLEQARAGYEPSAADEARVRASLHAQVLANPALLSPTNGGPAGAANVGRAGKLLSGKALGVLAVCGAGIAALAALHGLSRPVPPPASTPKLAPHAELVAPIASAPEANQVVAAPIAPALPPLLAASVPAVPRYASAAPQSSASLQQELTGLRQAQQLLHAGDPAGAVVVLDALSKEVPGGVLSEDRAATRAIAACGAGQGGAAVAVAFSARFPGSVHAARVLAACNAITAH